MVRVLFSSACYDYPTSVAYNLYTRYVEPYYRAKGIEVVQCHCQNALRDRIEETIEMYNPVAFIGCGHGAPKIYTGHGGSVVFYVCNVDPLKCRGVYLLSCSTAKELGYDIVNKGGKAYVGYYEDFTWVVGEPNTDPYGDIYQASFFRPIEVFLKALADGKTIKEATDAQVDQFNKEIEYWRNSGDPYAVYVIYYLIWDRDAIRLYGDERWKIEASETLEAETLITVEDRSDVERYVPRPMKLASNPVVPAIGGLSILAGLATEEEEARNMAILLGLGAVGLYLYSKMKYKPLQVVPRPIERMTATSIIEVTATVPRPVEIHSESSIATADYGAITPTVPIIPGSQVSIEDYAEIGYPIPVSGEEELYIHTEGTFEQEVFMKPESSKSIAVTGQIRVTRVLHATTYLSIEDTSTATTTKGVSGSETVAISSSGSFTGELSMRPTSSASIADGVDVRVARVVAPATSLSVADAVSVSVAMGVMGGETVAVSSTGSFTGELSMRPTSSASISDTAQASVVSGLNSIASIAIADAASIGATLGVSGSETVSVNSVAVIE